MVLGDIEGKIMQLQARFAGLFRPVDGDTLAVFRIAFGFLMATQAFGKYLGRADLYYDPEAFHFRYPLFEWVRPIPGVPPEIEVGLMGVAAVGIMLGLYFRVSAILFTAIYTHLFFVERSLFNNHFYLIILFGVLLCVTDSHAAFSMDAAGGRVKHPGWRPFWQVAIFRAQIVLVYFFGGIAKLGSDWLHGEPMRQWLLDRSTTHAGGWLLAHPWSAYGFSYSGLLFDLSIGWLLLYRRTRYWALIPLLMFHLMNAYLWKIGVFPWLAIASTVVFFDPGMPRRLLRRIDKSIAEAGIPAAFLPSLRYRRTVIACLAAYLLIQCLLPFRHHFYTHEVNWTETGHLFSWHMKLRDKDCLTEFTVEDPATGQVEFYDKERILEDLSIRQYYIMGIDPLLVLQYAHHLRDRAETAGIEDPIIKARHLVSLNGRPHQHLVDPNVNLAKVTRPLFREPDWIIPLDSQAQMGLYPKNTVAAAGDEGEP
jgi:hypothetical protein